MMSEDQHTASFKGRLLFLIEKVHIINEDK